MSLERTNPVSCVAEVKEQHASPHHAVLQKLFNAKLLTEKIYEKILTDSHHPFFFECMYDVIIFLAEVGLELKDIEAFVIKTTDFRDWPEFKCRLEDVRKNSSILESMHIMLLKHPNHISNIIYKFYMLTNSIDCRFEKNIIACVEQNRQNDLTFIEGLTRFNALGIPTEENLKFCSRYPKEANEIALLLYPLDSQVLEKNSHEIIKMLFNYREYLPEIHEKIIKMKETTGYVGVSALKSIITDVMQDASIQRVAFCMGDIKKPNQSALTNVFFRSPIADSINLSRKIFDYLPQEEAKRQLNIKKHTFEEEVGNESFEQQSLTKQQKV